MIDIKDRTPNEATIRQLEGMLEDAKRGNIRTVVAVIGWDDDRWSNMWSVDPRNTRRRLLGEMSMLHFDMLTKQAFDDGDSVLSYVIDNA